MQSPVLVFSRDRYDIESLTQQEPNDFKPSLLNAAAASGVKSIVRTSLALIGSGAGDCAPAPSHTTGHAVCRIRRLNAAASRRKVGQFFKDLPRTRIARQGPARLPQATSRPRP
jgi:hypothetical protein